MTDQLTDKHRSQVEEFRRIIRTNEDRIAHLRRNRWARWWNEMLIEDLTFTNYLLGVCVGFEDSFTGGQSPTSFTAGQSPAASTAAGSDPQS